jgi:hypothetical protein
MRPAGRVIGEAQAPELNSRQYERKGAAESGLWRPVMIVAFGPKARVIEDVDVFSCARSTCERLIVDVFRRFQRVDHPGWIELLWKPAKETGGIAWILPLLCL